MHKKRIILLVILVIALGIVAWVFYFTLPSAQVDDGVLTEEELLKFKSTATSSTLSTEDQKMIEIQYASKIGTTTKPMTGEELDKFRSN